MKQHHKLTVALCLIWTATILYGEMFAFWVPSLVSCSWPHLLLKTDGGGSSGKFTKVAVIADPQLMDKTSFRLPSRTLALELAQFYTDLNLRRSFFQSILPFKPDVILFLGDYFDGGPFLSEEEWQESLNRFRHVFGLNSQGKVGDIPVYYIPGNHDIGYSRVASHKPEVLDRYQKEFGIRYRRVL
ncbi:PREDICTED: metallophosphoesterase 1-like, partial [Tarenaya hassleriana]|uniref:metallophosphoesterase 1-like n=1 Tax=Tarenaya hassleriana TaxID=28532 RepID=UPI00053C9FD9